MVNIDAEDYKDILESAKAFAKKGKIAEILPEVKGGSLLEYRSKVFPDYNLLNNPDLRIDNVYMDVKRPSAIKNIQGNANKAHKQLAIAIIHTGRFTINEKQLQNRVKGVFGDNNVSQNGTHNYPYNVIYFLVNGKLLEYKKP